jgi:hypothetical protein
MVSILELHNIPMVNIAFIMYIDIHNKNRYILGRNKHKILSMYSTRTDPFGDSLGQEMSKKVTDRYFLK